MEIGASINGYIVLGVEGKPFSTKGGGLSTWTFVRKNGVDYFMKHFLHPTYPIEGSPGGVSLKTKKKLECEEFEKCHRDLKSIIDTHPSLKSNLIKTIEFFLSGAKYYKVTKKVEVAPVDCNEISRLATEKRLLFLKTLCQSLSVLHDLEIVHGDIKPENILISEVARHYYANLIDYDNCYFAGKPPISRDKVVGDLCYYSPELENYILNRSIVSRSDLTQKSDIFALGIIFSKYLTGEMPLGIPKGAYASNVVNNGSIIQINSKMPLPHEIVSLVNQMLKKNPSERPSIYQALDVFEKIPLRNITQQGRVIINWGKNSS